MIALHGQCIERAAFPAFIWRTARPRNSCALALINRAMRSVGGSAGASPLVQTRALAYN